MFEDVFHQRSVKRLISERETLDIASDASTKFLKKFGLQVQADDLLGWGIQIRESGADVQNSAWRESVEANLSKRLTALPRGGPLNWRAKLIWH